MTTRHPLPPIVAGGSGFRAPGLCPEPRALTPEPRGLVKWLLPILAASAVCHAPGALAESVGSPASILKKGQWVMGMVMDVLSRRSLRAGSEATVYQGGHARGYGLTDWLSLYGKIGAGHIEVDDASIRKRDDPSTTNRFGTNLLAGVQLKAKLFESRRKTWEWDGSLQYVDIRGRHRGDNEARWHEGQFATSLAKGLGRMKGYVGVKYDITHMVYRVREDGVLLRQDTYQEDSRVGFFAGTDLYFGRSEDVILNVETGYQDGAEVDVAIAYTF